MNQYVRSKINKESLSFLRQYENLLSCFSTLFGVEEFKIQEDVLQISELVNTENHFRSRSTPFDPIDIPHPRNKSKTLLKSFSRFWNIDQSFFTEYRGSLALLSEKFEESEEIGRPNEHWGSKSPLAAYLWLKYYAEWEKFPLKNGFWILGASYNYSLINAIDDIKYGKHSFYEQSLKTGKICKRGTSCFSKIRRHI